MKDFDLTDSFLSYATKPDPSNTDKHFLIRESINTLINDAEKISSRKGYSIFGAAGVSNTPCVASDDWLTSGNNLFNLRSQGTVLETYIDTLEGRSFASWQTVADSFTAVDFVFDSYWDNTEKIDREIFCNGSSTLYNWSGATTTFLSSSDTTTSVTEAGDVSNQLSGWSFTGARTTNMDTGAVLYWKLTNSVSTRTVNVYKDSAGTQLVASGSRSGDGVITLTAQNASGLSGSVIVAYSGDDTTVSANTLTLTFTVTKEGTGTFGAARFLTTGTRQIRIKDAGGTWRTFTYTGGESTTTLTGLTANPNEYTFAAGSLIFQALTTSSNIPAANYAMDFLRVINNQVHIGSYTDRRIFVSKNTSITDYTFSTPRIAGEGALFTLDQTARAIRSLKDTPVYFTKDYRYSVEFKEITVSTTMTETATCKRLKTAAGQGAKHHDLTAEVDNGIAYISEDNQLLILEDASDTYNPLISVLSDYIKPDFDDADFTGGHLRPIKNRLYISAPADSRVFIHETRMKITGEKVNFWQPPQTMPVARFMVRNDDTYGHSSGASETYKLFTGLRDRVDLTTTFDKNNGTPILCRGFLAKYNAGKKMRLKRMGEIAVEGYISPATNLLATAVIELAAGDTSDPSKTINGSDTRIVYSSYNDPSLGTNPLGEEALSGSSNDDNDEGEVPLSKFRAILVLNPVDFFDYEMRFESNDIDQRWEVLCTGPNAVLSDAHASGNKQ